MTQHERKDGVRVVPEYQIDTLGAPFKVTLRNAVKIGVNSTNGNETISVPDMPGLVRAVVRTRASHPRKLSGPEIKFIRDALGLKSRTLAQFLEIAPEHLSRCEHGTKVLANQPERIFRIFAMIASNWDNAELVLKERAIASTSEKNAECEPDDVVMKDIKRLFSTFFTMKIETVFAAGDQLHFYLERIAVTDTCDTDDEKWTDHFEAA